MTQLKNLDLLCQTLCNQTATTDSISAAEYVNQVLQSYPFEPGQHEFIRFNPANDFEIRFNPFFIQETLNALLKFALTHLEKSNGSLVEIWLMQESSVQSIHFKLHATAIEQSDHRYLFENFFTPSADKILPGLPFCQLALRYVGANISYELVAGHHLEVIISIP